MQVSDHVIYEFCFRGAAFFEDLANKSEMSGLTRKDIRVVTINKLAIDEAHRALLAQFSAQSLQEADKLDKQAEEIIRRDRALYPEGKLKTDKKP